MFLKRNLVPLKENYLSTQISHAQHAQVLYFLDSPVMKTPLLTTAARDKGSSPGQRTNIPHAAQVQPKKRGA